MSEPVLDRVKTLLAETLVLGERGAALGAATPLLGSMPELDSLAVLQLAMAIEDEFGITIDDEDFGSELFESVGTLARYVEGRLAARGGAVLAAE